MKAEAAGLGDPILTASSPHRRPGILLDRDGTIIVDHGYVGSVDRVEFIDGAAEAIARFNRAGIPVAVVTNQAGVARGLYGIDDVARVHRYIAEHLAEHGAHIDLFLYCPYHPAGVVEAFARTSEDRKPRPGMAKAAAAALNLDLTASWVVGDRPEDIGLAEAVGASAIYLGTDDCPAPRCLVVPEPRRRGPVHPGARSRYEFRLRSAEPCARLPTAAAVKFPVAPYAERRRRTSTPTPRRWPGPAKTIDPAALDRAAAILPRGLRARRPDVLLRQRRLGVDREPHAMRPREGRPDGDRPHPAGAEPEHQRGAAHRDSQRHGLRERLRLPASVPVEARRRAHRRLVVGPFAQHRATR